MSSLSHFFTAATRVGGVTPSKPIWIKAPGGIRRTLLRASDALSNNVEANPARETSYTSVAAMLHLQRLLAPLLSFAFLIFLFPNAAHATAGDLDPTYGNGGKVISDFLGNSEIIRHAAVQPDGKLVVVGDGVGSDGIQRFGLVRYRLNGSLDMNFGSGGRVIDLRGVRAATVSVQDDGKIIAAGQVSPGDFGLVRFNKDGSLDTSFGNAGLATTDFFGTSDQIWNLALQPDGKIVAIGDADNANWLALARFNANGSLDTTFGNGGRLTPGIGPGIEQGLAIAIQSDLKIVAVGQAYNGALRKSDFALLRLEPNGELDESFGNAGKVLTDFSNGYDVALAVAIQPDGKILAAGEAPDKFGVVRYNVDGSLDETFGSGGRVITSFFGRGDVAMALALQSDGKIIAAGSAVFTGGDGTSGAVRDFALARYNGDGTLDTTFGDQGKVTTNFGGDSVATSALLQPDGKLVAAGSANFADFALARYLTTPTNSPVLQTEANSNHALALDSVTYVKDPFSVTSDLNFSADHRTRILLFATNLTLAGNEAFSSVTVQAEDTGGGIHVLPVEYVGEVPGSEWLTQVVVKLPDDLAHAGSVQVSISHGNTSNKGSLLIN
jgi:uncharacterized delta-60 repeat protein